MSGLEIAVDADPEHMEKIINVCGTRLGQCQEQLNSNENVKLRLCCLDCNFKESVADGSAFKNPHQQETERRNRRVKVVVALVVITLLIATVTFLAYKRYFVKERA